MKEKGIEDAIAAVKAVNKIFGFTVCKLDIYGQISETYESRFDEMKKEFKEEIQYCDCVNPSESVDVLKQYFALLFPTYYEGEGFAGTIIDAFSAGIPVVASDWKYNKEIVGDGVGAVYHTGNNKELEAIMIDFCRHPQKALSMKKKCLMESNKYTADHVIRQLNELIS